MHHGALLLAIALAVGGCGPSGITKSKLESSLAPTFANLIVTQETMLGRPRVNPQVFEASATCQRVGPGHDSAGSGNWDCMVSWSIPGRRPLHDGYDVAVMPNGCYTASADRTGAHVGGPRVTTPEGATIPNLLYVFDGCLDTASP